MYIGVIRENFMMWNIFIRVSVNIMLKNSWMWWISVIRICYGNVLMRMKMFLVVMFLYKEWVNENIFFYVFDFISCSLFVNI